MGETALLLRLKNKVISLHGQLGTHLMSSHLQNQNCQPYYISHPTIIHSQRKNQLQRTFLKTESHQLL